MELIIMFTDNMKKLFQILLVGCGLIVTTSCDNFVNYDDNYQAPDLQANTGLPVITAVYDIADTELTTALTKASQGQTVLIVGENLNNLRSLKFNTVEADVANTYTMQTRAVVTVPQEFSKGHENTIEYTTDMGTATYQFVVDLPQAIINGLENEFVNAGSEVTVTGKNLTYYDFTAMMAGQELSLHVKGDSLISFTIPTGIADGEMINISWTQPDGSKASRLLPFRPVNQLLFADIAQTKQQQTDSDVSIETSDLGQPCLHFMGVIKEWAWVELSFEQPLESVIEPTAVADYQLVFEVQNAEGKPLLGTGHEFAWNFDWNHAAIWNPGNGEGLDTKGEWLTVRLPLEQMAPEGLSGTTITLNVGFQPSKYYDADFRIANFRIVKQ